MSKSRLLGAICASVLTFSLSNSAQAAFVIDDFNVDTAKSILNNTTGTSSVASPIDGANIVVGGATGWTRTLWADSVLGESVTTSVCDTATVNCGGAGLVSIKQGSSESVQGIGTFAYVGPAIDLSAYNFLTFDWGANVAGAEVEIAFIDGAFNATTVTWSALADTGGSTSSDLVTQSLMQINWGVVHSNAITEIQFTVKGWAEMDSIIDNISMSAVPVPAAVWLFGSGLLGLVGMARRKKV